jgi:hypothetical protein
MKVLVACEESQTVCTAFRERGHEAYSNDIIECSGGHPEWHLQVDALEAIKLMDWDLMIAHPPCTYLCLSGIRWNTNNPKRQGLTNEAIHFMRRLLESPIHRIAVENPIGVCNSIIGKPTQIVRPLQFGHGSSKATCLWLKNLPKLLPTNIVQQEYYISSSGRKWDKWFFETSLVSNLGERSKLRSKTFLGIANAMAEQWGK